MDDRLVFRFVFRFVFVERPCRCSAAEGDGKNQDSDRVGVGVGVGAAGTHGADSGIQKAKNCGGANSADQTVFRVLFRITIHEPTQFCQRVEPRGCSRAADCDERCVAMRGFFRILNG